MCLALSLSYFSHACLLTNIFFISCLELSRSNTNIFDYDKKVLDTFMCLELSRSNTKICLTKKVLDKTFYVPRTRTEKVLDTCYDKKKLYLT